MRITYNTIKEDDEWIVIIRVETEYLDERLIRSQRISKRALLSSVLGEGKMLECSRDMLIRSANDTKAKLKYGDAILKSFKEFEVFSQKNAK